MAHRQHTHTHTGIYAAQDEQKKEQKEKMVFMCAAEDAYVFLCAPTNSTIFSKYLEISNIDFYNNISAVSAVGVGEFKRATTVATKIV